MDVRGWLRSLGLEQYEAAFRENAIDAYVLHPLGVTTHLAAKRCAGEHRHPRTGKKAERTAPLAVRFSRWSTAARRWLQRR
jgi:hypothetical protein